MENASQPQQDAIPDHLKDELIDHLYSELDAEHAARERAEAALKQAVPALRAAMCTFESNGCDGANGCKNCLIYCMLRAALAATQPKDGV